MTTCVTGLHPKILLFIPQLVLLHIITSAYYKRYGQPSSHAQEEDASSKESSLESSSKAPVQRASKSSPTSRSSTAAASASDVQPNSSQNASARRPFTFNLSSALFPTFDESSPEYLKNMQNLQNMMGEVSDIYDLVAANAHYFDWSSEADTMRVLQAVVFSMVVLLGLVWFIPLNIICLVTGVSVFLMNTRFAKYCIKEIMPYALKFGQTKMEYVARWYAKLERQLEEQERVRQVSLFENQRWWSGSGFAPQVEHYDRTCLVFALLFNLVYRCSKMNDHRGPIYRVLSSCLQKRTCLLPKDTNGCKMIGSLIRLVPGLTTY